MLARFFEHGKDLLALYAGKAIEKVFDGIAVFQMVEKALLLFLQNTSHRIAGRSMPGLGLKSGEVLCGRLGFLSNRRGNDFSLAIPLFVSGIL